MGTKSIIIKSDQSCLLLFTVPSGELFCLYFFFFFLFSFFYLFISSFFSFFPFASFCLGLFLLGFSFCFINQKKYFIDEESSVLVTCSRWWAVMGYFRKNSNRWQRGEDWGHRFSGKDTWKSRVQLKRSGISRGVHEKLMEFPRVFVFDL